MTKYLIGVVCLLFLMSCTDEVIKPDLISYDQYYPVDTAYTYYYKVDSIRYNDFNPSKVDTVVRYLKVEVADPFMDEAGEKVFQLKRYLGMSEFGPWTLINVWTVRKLDSDVILTVGNMKYVKLVFPVKEGKSWNGNAYNSMAEESYTFKMAHKPMVLGDLHFDSTVTVVERADSNLIFQDKMNSAYATGIGLVYSERVEMETQPDPENPNKFTRNGYITRQSMVRYELK